MKKEAEKLKNKERVDASIEVNQRNKLLSIYKIPDLGGLAECLSQKQFVNQALVLTCLSMLLEVFGQVYISLGTSFGYLIYFMQPKFIMLMIHMT